MTALNLRTMSEEELNSHVQAMSTFHAFQSAANLIKVWVDLEKARTLLGIDPVDFDEEEPRDELFKQNISDRLKTEFGKWGPDVEV